jgi:hypothetical protein
MTGEERAVIAQLWGDGRFHLTGSRFWNRKDPLEIPLSPDTDVDFVAEHDPEIISDALKIGFRPREENHALKDGYAGGDGTTVDVLYFGCIQIILKYHVDVYLAVQNSVGVEFYKNYLWKKNSAKDNIQTVLKFLYELECQKRGISSDIGIGELTYDY